MNGPKNTGLLPWEREALEKLRKLTVGGREMILGTCHFMAIRESERLELASREKAKRPVFQLVQGGRT